MDTFSKIRDIFHSGSHAFRTNSESIKEIAFLVDNNYLHLSEIDIASRGDYYAMLTDTPLSPNSIQKYNAAGGDEGHVVLKILSGQYIKKHKHIGIHYEHSFCGYYPDVLTEDKLTVIECGHTQNSEKILHYFSQGRIHEFIQVPYLNEGDEVVTGFIFTKGVHLLEFLTEFQKQQRSPIRDIMNKNRLTPLP